MMISTRGRPLGLRDADGSTVGRTEGQQQGVQSVEVAMRAVEALERLGSAAPLSAVAAEAGMSPSTTHRYLVSLARVGLVAQDPRTNFYDLGPAARRLGIEAIRRSDDITLATVHASSLRDSTGHTVNVSVWSDSGPIIVRWEYGRFPLPIMARVGSTLPLVDSSVGRVFLAYLPSLITEPVLQSQQFYEETTTPDPDELAATLEQVRADLYSTTVGGVLPGLTVVAAPVLGPGESLALVLAVAVLSRFSQPTTIDHVRATLLDTAEQLSIELGGSTARAG